MTGALNVLMAGSSPLTASIDPAEAIGIGTGTVETNTVSATISGGVAPYLTNWIRTGGSPLIDPTNYTAPSTAFSSAGVTMSTVRNAAFELQITDTIGNTLNVGPVAVQIMGSL